MMRSLLLASALLLAARPAYAGQLEITFEFATSTTVSAYGGQAQVPPQGNLASTNGVLVVPAAGPAYPQAGASSLGAAGFDLSIDALSLGANVLGALMASQVGTANGTLSDDLGDVQLTDPLVLDLTVDLDCGGNTQMCSMIGTFPVAFSGTQNIPSGSMLMLTDLNLPGQAELAGTMVLAYSGTTAVVDLVGKEVSRDYVPEPDGLTALGAGISALWLLSRRRRIARPAFRDRG